MLNINDRMKEIISNESNQQVDEKMHNFLKEIVSKTRIIKDCIIYCDESIIEEDVNWDGVFKLVDDYTGYEIANNEFICDKNEYKNNSYLGIASDLKSLLQSTYKNKKFVIYVIILDDDIQIRFHTYRTTKMTWLEEDLNKYNEPILCLM